MTIPTYIINLKARKDRKKHISKEFADREEFSTTIIEASKHEVGAVGLWSTIQKIIQEAINKHLEYVLICEDDHQFTEAYSKDILFACIYQAQLKNASLLLGGVSWFQDSLQISRYLFWVGKFTGLQFTIFFKNFFYTLVNAPFEIHDSADYKVGSLTMNKFMIAPFISTQKEFGYSDVTTINNSLGRVEKLFMSASQSIRMISDINVFYKRLSGITASRFPKIDNLDNVAVSTYIIKYTDKKILEEQFRKQFEGRTEFDIKIISAVKHQKKAMRLWLSIRKIIQLAIVNEDDVIIICEDNHKFTKDYDRDALLINILEANLQGVDYISGFAKDLDYVIPITRGRFWITPNCNTQFIIVFKRLFKKILETSYDHNVIPGILLSQLTNNKMVLFPFISVQKEIKHSDALVADKRIEEFLRRQLFSVSRRLEDINNAYIKYID